MQLHQSRRHLVDVRQIAAAVAVLTIVATASACLPGDDSDQSSQTLAPSPGPTIAPSDLSLVIGDPFGADGIDPCSLVFVDEVAAILERTDLTTWRTMRSNGSRLCEYYTDADPLGSVTVRMESDASHESLAEAVSDFESFTRGAKPADFGDEAFVVDRTALYILKDSTLLVIFAIVEDESSLAASEAFATRALARLPGDAP